ncbi:hypothetical protein CAPTEDRAFT_193782 [Capitella teleta]|uniref:C-type lectin domain-containing protein n=1 Tax=Capitella teleta TaxID=283909 RepID=R7V9W8_CAPTE|nr:hypothetical protein CAPTEDRAFT_193782 [Capitella teleta]|eukprot:ELU15302.1 hypothetical protein CAPTEDRAFT_193782 [Capitella teleta]
MMTLILNETLLCYCCNELPSQYERDDDNCGAECINGDDVCGYENYARVIANEAYVTSEPVSWFVAQEFCHDVEVTHDTYTERLYTNTIANIADLDEIDHTEDYWTQLSSLHLISPDPTDTFGDLPWTDGYPESEDGICIRAEKINNEIELITSDCDDDFQFICFSSKPGEESVTPPTDESTTQMGIIIGSVIGGSIVVIIVVVALAVFLVKRERRRTSESSSKGNLSEGNDVIQGEENAESAHIYEEISDAANSGGDSHEYENANAAKNTRDEPHSVTMANDDQINSHNTKARDQQDETPYLILLDSEQQSDHLWVASISHVVAERRCRGYTRRR